MYIEKAMNVYTTHYDCYTNVKEKNTSMNDTCIDITIQYAPKTILLLNNTKHFIQMYQYVFTTCIDITIHELLIQYFK